MAEPQTNHPWLAVPPSSPRVGKVARPPRSPSNVTNSSPYSKKRPSDEVAFPDMFSFQDQSSWPVDPVKRPGHRRSASDSMTFMEGEVRTLRSPRAEPASIFEEGHLPGARPLNGFGELPDSDCDNVMAMFLDMDAIQHSLLARADPESLPGKPAPKHRRGASEGGVSSWLPSSEFAQADQSRGLASVWEMSEPVPPVHSQPSHTQKRRGHQRTFSEPPALLSEETSFASEEDIKPCISGGFLDRNGTTEDNRVVGLEALKQELGITGPVKESELELLQMDPRKAKRVLANRQSAQKSRIRKLHYISDLEKRVIELQMDLRALQPRVTLLDQQRSKLNSANSDLKQKIAALQQETGFKDALNEALQKEVERLRQNIASNSPMNGQSNFQLGTNGLPFHHAPFASDSNGPAASKDSGPAVPGEVIEYEHMGMDFGQSRDSFQHYLDDFNANAPFLLDSM